MKQQRKRGYKKESMKKHRLIIILSAVISSQMAMEIDQGLLNNYLFRAIAARDAQEANYWIEQGADVNATTRDEETPLMIAATNNDLAMIEALLKNDADINACSTGDFAATPLIRAAENGNFEIVQIFLNHSADINAKGAFDLTPLHAAAKNGHAAAVKLLIEHGAQLDAHAFFYSQQDTPLTMAVLSENENENTILTLLSTLSNADAQKIRDDIRGLIGVRYAQPLLPKDIRILITQRLIDKHVEEHMEKIRRMITDTLASRDQSDIKGNPKNIALIDLTNPESVKKIRKTITNNIKQILLGAPKIKSEHTANEPANKKMRVNQNDKE